VIIRTVRIKLNQFPFGWSIGLKKKRKEKNETKQECERGYARSKSLDLSRWLGRKAPFFLPIRVSVLVSENFGISSKSDGFSEEAELRFRSSVKNGARSDEGRMKGREVAPRTDDNRGRKQSRGRTRTRVMR